MRISEKRVQLYRSLAAEAFYKLRLNADPPLRVSMSISSSVHALARRSYLLRDELCDKLFHVSGTMLLTMNGLL